MISKRVKTSSVDETVELGRAIGSNLRGGEVLEFVSDLGGGKTTFIGGLTAGFGSTDPVASPSFTISYTYSREDGKRLHHFDFYRLDEAGIVGDELEEFLDDPESVVAIEWGEIVHDILPAQRVRITIRVLDEFTREVALEVPESMNHLLSGVTDT